MPSSAVGRSRFAILFKRTKHALRCARPLSATIPPHRVQIEDLLMTRSIISTPKAPQAIGTYSQAVKCGSTVYVSGQIPLDPATAQLVPGDMETQIMRVFDNLQAIVTTPGGGFSDVAKLNGFLVDH